MGQISKKIKDNKVNVSFSTRKGFSLPAWNFLRSTSLMKHTLSFGFSFFFVSILLGGLVLWYTHTSYVRALHVETFDVLDETLSIKSKKIQNYLASIERDIHTLMSTSEVQSILERETFFEVSTIVRDVDRRARIIVREVENYIVAHPQMTLKNLQESEEFKTIALQSVGKEGYSALIEYKRQIVLMHIFEKFIGLNLKGNLTRDTLPEIYQLTMESQTKEEVSGFYDWREPNGEIRRKYARFSHIGARTADGVGVMVSVSAYVDDYKIVRNIPASVKEYVDTFRKDFEYSNIVFITPSGYVTYAAEVSPLLGGNLTWSVNKKNGLAHHYVQVRRENQPSFFGPFIDSYGDLYPSLSIMAPVFAEDGERLLGYVAIVDEMDRVFIITEKRTDTSDTQETYLVNGDNLLISPVRTRDLDIFVQSVKSENTTNCFEDPKDGRVHDEIEVFFNYRGDEVLGVHDIVPNVFWCVLTEINYEEAIMLPVWKHIKSKIPLFIFVLTLLTFVGFGLGWFMGVRKKK